MKTPKFFPISLSLLALAALSLPAANVLADDDADTGDETMTWTDTIQATIPSYCALGFAAADDSETAPSSLDQTYSATLTVGTVQEWSSVTDKNLVYQVICNDGSGWQISAVGTGAYSENSSYLYDSGISRYIETGSDFTATTARRTGLWAMSVALVADATDTTLVSIATGYDSYHAVPALSTVVLSSTDPTNATTGEFTTAYKILVGSETAAGTYVGGVQYTLVHPKTIGGNN